MAELESQCPVCGCSVEAPAGSTVRCNITDDGSEHIAVTVPVDPAPSTVESVKETDRG